MGGYRQTDRQQRTRKSRPVQTLGSLKAEPKSAFFSNDKCHHSTIKLDPDRKIKTLNWSASSSLSFRKEFGWLWPVQRLASRASRCFLCLREERRRRSSTSKPRGWLFVRGGDETPASPFSRRMYRDERKGRVGATCPDRSCLKRAKSGR